ncbi:MAG: tetratricopeptide repeat protein [Treponema sp.]|jgi:tetratricopeptide (TPR) repeat protein|nr:tetratricopeptide repeat protein [Treponema sp.]
MKEPAEPKAPKPENNSPQTDNTRQTNSARRKDNSKDQEKLNTALESAIRLYRIKRWDSALAELLAVDTGILSPEENLERSYYLGLCHTKLEQYHEAVFFLEQVVASSADLLRAYQCRMALAYIYVITNRSKQAESELKKLASSGFESAQLYTTLAYAAWIQKQFKQAVDYYEKALDFDEGNATALNGLGYILVDTDMDILRGLRCCKRAVDIKPKNPVYLDSLGWAYFKNGELLEARTWLRRALDAAPKTKEIKEHFNIVTGAK